MTELKSKSKPVKRYQHPVDHWSTRVFGEDLPSHSLVLVKTSVNVEVVELVNDSEDSNPHDPCAVDAGLQYVQDIAAKVQEHEEFLKLRESAENMAILQFSGTSEDFQEDGVESRPLAVLADALETNPQLAASLVVDGILGAATEHAWRRQLVITAETIHFSDEQDEQLLPALCEFVRSFRDSNDLDDNITVCSAIRSIVALTPASQVHSLAWLLESGHRASLSQDGLLEVVKMLARKFSVHPPETSDQYAMLSEQVRVIAEGYMHPHVFPHGKSAAIAMNAVQALAGMGSPNLRVAIDDVNARCPAWFRQQLHRRLRQLVLSRREGCQPDAIEHESTVTAESVFDTLLRD